MKRLRFYECVPTGARDPLTSKQVTVRYDSHGKLLRVFRADAELAEAVVRQNVSRVFFRNTRCARFAAFQSCRGVSLCLTRTTEQHS
jgi:YD repeat-containing protein